MATSDKRIWSVRELLRHLDHPSRLRDNPLAGSYFEGARDDVAALVRVKAIIENALSLLPARQQQIVRRCDFRGDPHARVIAALAISERQFYRERRTALESIADALQNAQTTQVNESLTHGDGAASIELCFADAAFQVGDAKRALDILRVAAAQNNDKQKQILLECRLAEFACESGTAEMMKHIDKSRALCEQLDEAERIATAARIDAWEANVSWRARGSLAAVELAKRATAELRSFFEQHPTIADAEALGLAAIVLCERDFTIGRPESGRQRALDALQAMSLFEGSRAVLKMRLRAAAATAYMYGFSHLRAAAAELNAQYRDALSSGLALEATLIGWRLSNFHRFSQSHELAVSVLRDLLPVARQLLPREERAGLCLDLASAQLVCGRARDASHLIAEAKVDVLPNGFCDALVPLIAAEVQLLERAYEETLTLCDTGIAAMQKLGRQQSVVNGLRLQAEAHFGLGNIAAAKQCIGTALERIDASPHPLVVAKTHRTAARVTGRHKHRRIADEIIRALRA